MLEGDSADTETRYWHTEGVEFAEKAEFILVVGESFEEQSGKGQRTHSSHTMQQCTPAQFTNVRVITIKCEILPQYPPITLGAAGYSEEQKRCADSVTSTRNESVDWLYQVRLIEPKIKTHHLWRPRLYSKM